MNRPLQNVDIVSVRKSRRAQPPASALEQDSARASHAVHPVHMLLPRLTLYAGDVHASEHPLVLHTLLGSCIAVCLFDPVACIGGMNHILLPNSHGGSTNSRYGVHAMELLINAIMKLGGDRRRFIAKAFGGANFLIGSKQPSIGARNAGFVREFLEIERIPLLSERIGGSKAIHVYFQANSGRASVQVVGDNRTDSILREERRYGRSLSKQAPSDDITLF